MKTKTPKIEYHRHLPRTESHLRRLFAVLHENVDALDIGRFNYRPGFGSGMCDFKLHCRTWAG